MTFQHKLVAVLNKDIETGVALNAAAHMVLGLGADTEKSLLRLDTYSDANGNAYPNISQIPFIILRAKAGEIRKTVQAAREHKLAHGVFLNTMTGGTYVEQLARTRETPEDQLIFYGCVLFGEWDVVSNLTKKFSLWR